MQEGQDVCHNFLSQISQLIGKDTGDLMCDKGNRGLCFLVLQLICGSYQLKPIARQYIQDLQEQSEKCKVARSRKLGVDARSSAAVQRKQASCVTDKLRFSNKGVR